MGTIPLLVIVVGAAYAGPRDCYGKCGVSDVSGCSCSGQCASYHNEGCCSDFLQYCGSQYPPINQDGFNSIKLHDPMKSCVNPETRPNSYHSGGLKKYFSVGDTIRYSCRRGYSIIGRNQRVCTKSKNYTSFPVPPHWTPELPECMKIKPCDSVKCGFQSSCVNVDDSKFRCQCHTGYSSYGKKKKCRRNCVAPPQPSHGRYDPVFQSYKYRSIIKFSCDTGYRLFGKSKRRCNFHGKFVQSSCEDINECLKNPCHKHAVCINIDGSFQCVCTRGYIGDGFFCSVRE